MLAATLVTRRIGTAWSKWIALVGRASVIEILRAFACPRLGQLAKIERQHAAPRRPIVGPLFAPRDDAIGNALATQDVGHAPRLADVLGAALAGGEQHVAPADRLERVAVECGQEV